MLIHIGFRKAASSFLQAHVFGDPDGPFGVISAKHPELFGIPVADELPYDPETANQVFTNAREQTRQAGKFPVLSRERYAGRSSHAGPKLDTLSTRLETMARLKQLEPKAKILLVIREQLSAQLSTHNQYVKLGGKFPLRRYSSPAYRKDGLDQRSHYLYHELIEAYYQAFGKDRVLVVPYELLKSDANVFVKQITDFCGIAFWRRDWDKIPAANAGLNETANVLKRMTNIAVDFWPHDTKEGKGRLPWSVHRRIARIVNMATSRGFSGLNSRLRGRARAQLEAINGDHFARSNRLTEQLTGLDLGQYGYRL